MSSFRLLRLLDNLPRAPFSPSATQRIPFPIPDALPLAYLLWPLGYDALWMDRIVVGIALHLSFPPAAKVFFFADSGQQPPA